VVHEVSLRLRCRRETGIAVTDTHSELFDAIRMIGITKRFGSKWALNQVDFSAKRGEIHALLGENGAGKSTLLRILRGVELPDAGTIEVYGERRQEHSLKASQRAGVAMIFQDTSLIPTLSVAQNVFLNHEPRTRFGLIDDREAISMARRLFEDFGVNIDPTIPAAELGAGQSQLTEIIKAVSQHARILILDEPTSALSEVEVERLFVMLRRLKADGVAMIYVSQRMDQIMRIADRASILRDGRRVITALLSDLTIETIVEHIIGRESPSLSEALLESEHRFQQLAENIHEVFWVVDYQSRRILYVSPAYEQVWGRSRDRLYPNSRSFLETVHEDDRARIRDAYECEIGSQVSPELEYRIVRPDGTIRWISDRRFPIRDDTGQISRFVRITEDTTDRKRTAEELQHSFAQLRALAAKLQSVREEERTRVAREIHDELGQALTAIKIDLSSLVVNLPPQSEAPSKKADAILNLVDQTIQSVRRISTELRPGILDDLGLLAAIEWATEEFERRTGAKCILELPPDEFSIAKEQATAVFRIFQETLTNVARHANATQLNIHLTRANGYLSLEVQDNGRGLNEGRLKTGRSLGILGMRERALLLGGELTITSAPDMGTLVKVQIPANGLGKVDTK
jgi:PAS domain S-box-containing protein